MRHRPGALFEFLKELASRNINLTKIESRPSRRKLGEYIFFMDYENKGMNAKECETLHARIKERTTYLKDLGSYRRL